MANHTKHYDWKALQEAYDSGLSQNELVKKFGVGRGAIHKAMKRGDFVSRSYVEAGNLWAKSSKFPHRDASDPIEKERRRKLSEIAKKNGYGGYREGSGRGKKCWYEGKWGKVWCDSSYEVRMSKLLDSLDVKWIKNLDRFPYEWNGKQHDYIPDFYIPEWNLYIETKGYQTEKDDAKWRAFPHKLKIVFEKDLIDLESQPSGVATRFENG